MVRWVRSHNVTNLLQESLQHLPHEVKILHICIRGDYRRLPDRRGHVKHAELQGSLLRRCTRILRRHGDDHNLYPDVRTGDQ